MQPAVSIICLIGCWHASLLPGLHQQLGYRSCLVTDEARSGMHMCPDTWWIHRSCKNPQHIFLALYLPLLL